MAKLNRAIELHDSEIESITQLGDRVTVVFSAAYIHKYEGDYGTGWTQAAQFTFDEAAMSGMLPEFPCAIWHGSLKVDGKPYDLIPIHLGNANFAEVEFVFDTKHRVVIQGKRPKVELLGEARFVENLPWKSPGVS